MLKTGENGLHPNYGAVKKFLALMTFFTAIGFKTRNGKKNPSCGISQIDVTTQNIQRFEFIQRALRLVLGNQPMQFTEAHLFLGA